jgi:hypothetical protein
MGTETSGVLVTDIPFPWKRPHGETVTGHEFPEDRPMVVDLVFASGLRTAETRTAMYLQRPDGVWDLARFVRKG